MLKDLTSPSADGSYPSLAALSRNASVISSSSSSDSVAQDLLTTPRPRPLRTFSSPRSASPASPSPKSSRAPTYLIKQFGSSNLDPAQSHQQASQSRAASKARSKSRGRSNVVTIDDFDVGEILGEGSYSTVMEATFLRTGHKFAIKALDKVFLVRKQKMGTAMVEKGALMRLGHEHPGIVHLHYAFQDDWSLYFVLDFASNGEMQSMISRMGSFSTNLSQYYTAQLVDALAYMHGKKVIHRDLKPENLLLTDTFRLMIADFGTAKILDNDVEAERFVGTAQYVAPELVQANETSESSDLWALACILYQMISGRFAFSGLSEFLTLQKVKQMDYTFPEGFDEKAKDLVQKLLVRDPAQRLGAGEPGSSNDMQALRSHPFFSGIDWTTLWSVPAPPLEPGLVKRDHRLAKGQDRNWEDIGSAWDALVSENDAQERGAQRGDGIEWADADETSEVRMMRQNQFDTTGHMQRMNVPLMSSNAAHENTVAGDLDATPLAVTPRAPATSLAYAPSNESPSTDSPCSSSDGGDSMERITTEMQSMQVSKGVLRHEKGEDGRGRNQYPTPVQGNSWSTELLSILKSNETIAHRSEIEVRSIRRRASRLLPLGGGQMKPKTRELVLTNCRLICVKHTERASERVSLKSELFLRPLDKVVSRDGKDKEKEKESRPIVLSAERKGEREFVVLSSGKNFNYAASDPLSATAWIEKINAAASGQ